MIFWPMGAFPSLSKWLLDLRSGAAQQLMRRLTIRQRWPSSAEMAVKRSTVPPAVRCLADCQHSMRATVPRGALRASTNTLCQVAKSALEVYSHALSKQRTPRWPSTPRPIRTTSPSATVQWTKTLPRQQSVPLGLRSVTIEVRRSEVDTLIARRLLAPEERADRSALRKAIHRFLDMTLVRAW